MWVSDAHLQIITTSLVPVVEAVEVSSCDARETAFFSYGRLDASGRTFNACVPFHPSVTPLSLPKGYQFELGRCRFLIRRIGVWTWQAYPSERSLTGWRTRNLTTRLWTLRGGALSFTIEAAARVVDRHEGCAG